MAPIPVLYVLDALHDPAQGGTEAHLTQLLTRLDPRRVAPEVAVFRPTAFVLREAALPCRARVLNIASLRQLSTVARLLRLRRAVSEGGFRIVHVYLNDASMVVPPLLGSSRARVVVSRRDMGFWYTPTILRLLRVSNRFVNRMIVNSEAVAENVRRREGVAPARTVVIPNGVDLDAHSAQPPAAGWRERLGIGPADPVIGMVAHFHPWKRQRDLIRAFARVRTAHPSAHLVLVGAGSQVADARLLCRELSLSQVHFTGAISNVIAVLKHFTVGVLCSASEGSSNAVLEYLSCGLPVISTSTGGNGEAVEEGVTGFLVSPGDIDALSERLTRLLDRPMEAAAMGRRAREAVERYAMHAMVEEHMRLYERLCERAPAC